MRQIYEKMEQCFRSGFDRWAQLAQDPEWRVRYAAAVAGGGRTEREALEVLDGMLETEDARPLYSQPEPQYVGTSGDSALAEQVKPFGVIFPAEPDEATKEAWKCRGRIKQAVLFAVCGIGAANDALLDKMHRYVEDPAEDASVKCAALKALGVVGTAASMVYCERASAHGDTCIRMEAAKTMGVLRDGRQ